MFTLKGTWWLYDMNSLRLRDAVLKLSSDLKKNTEARTWQYNWKHTLTSSNAVLLLWNEIKIKRRTHAHYQKISRRQQVLLLMHPIQQHLTTELVQDNFGYEGSPSFHYKWWMKQHLLKKEMVWVSSIRSLDTHGRTELGRTDKGYREKRYPESSVEPGYSLFSKHLCGQSWNSYWYTRSL